MPLADDLRDLGLRPRDPLALVATPHVTALAWDGGRREVAEEPVAVVAALVPLAPRWTWWSARETAVPLVAAGLRVRKSWDLGAVGRSLHGLSGDDAGAVWAAAQGLPPPDPPPRRGPDLFDLAAEDSGPVGEDGQLSPSWLAGGWRDDPSSWAALAVQVRAAQERGLRGLPDPRPGAGLPPLAVLTAWAESAAALLAVELEHGGLPLDPDVAARHLRELVGPRPCDEAEEAVRRAARDADVLRHFPGPPVDLRSPGQVRDLLARAGFDVPDTRSWRLEPHAATSPGVAALLRWRKAERTATTYGWSWLDRAVGPDRRLRGSWRAADGAAGRMTASAGLHNLPAELRPAVRAEAGRALVRADLGQVEPRVLAVVSGDTGLARAAREEDLYSPVAAALRCDRPTAKVAVLAAMYGQTSGTAGAALRDLDRAFPTAMGFLRAAEQAGLHGSGLRTYGGRLLRLSGSPPAGEPVGEHVSVPSGAGRFARNAVVQGAAAELFKAWAATVRDRLPALEGEIVLCLHDELLLQVPAAQVPAARALLHEALQATASWWAAGSGVRFVADVGVGASWAAAH